MQLTERMENHSGDTRDTLMLLSGVSLVIFGAGLILTTPVIKKLLGGAGIGSLLQAAGPDLQRYLKLRAM